MKKIVVIALLFLIFFPPHVFAESDYVLPYPSSMPGNKLYLVEQLKDKFMQYWYFGNFGQCVYNLGQADKYLVEAKTLFEYKQYLLANQALQKSDYYFQRAPFFLENARKENKNISVQKTVFHDAARKHIEVLQKAESELPENFIWTPEKSSPTALHIKQIISKSIKIRTQGL